MPESVNYSEPQEFCDRVMHFLQENSQMESVVLRVFKASATNMKRKPWKCGSFVGYIEWRPSDRGEPGSDAYWIPDFLLSDRVHAKMANLQENACYAVHAKAPAGDQMIAAAFVNLKEEQEESEASPAAAKPASPISNISTKFEQAMMSSLEKQLDRMINPEGTAGTIGMAPLGGEGMIPMGDGSFRKASDVAGLWKTQNDAMAKLSTQMERLRHQQEKNSASGSWGPVIELATNILKRVPKMKGNGRLARTLNGVRNLVGADDEDNSDLEEQDQDGEMEDTEGDDEGMDDSGEQLHQQAPAGLPSIRKQAPFRAVAGVGSLVTGLSRRRPVYANEELAPEAPPMPRQIARPMGRPAVRASVDVLAAFVNKLFKKVMSTATTVQMRQGQPAAEAAAYAVATKEFMNYANETHATNEVLALLAPGVDPKQTAKLFVSKVSDENLASWQMLSGLDTVDGLEDIAESAIKQLQAQSST